MASHPPRRLQSWSVGGERLHVDAGFNLNEMAGVTGASRTKTAAFSDFVDIAEGSFNQKQLGAFQKEFAAIRSQNDQLPAAARLNEKDLEVDPVIKALLDDQGQAMVTEVHNVCAYENLCQVRTAYSLHQLLCASPRETPGH